jgi:hypothetical protein
VGAFMGTEAAPLFRGGGVEKGAQIEALWLGTALAIGLGR